MLDLDLIFFKLQTDRSFFLVGRGGGGGGAGADFFQQLKLALFIDKVKLFFLQYICLQLLLGPIYLLTSVSAK